MPRLRVERDEQLDRDLAQRMRSGDRVAYEELFRGYYNGLVAYANSFVAAPDAAEDIVQDVLHRFWAYRERDDFPPLNVGSYLFAAVRRTVATHFRHRRVVERWQENAGSRSPEESAISARSSEGADEQARFNELVAAARVAVAELSPRCRQAFLLSRQHGMTYGEIAEVMGISRNTVEIHVSTALRTLSVRLGAFLDD